MKRFRWLLATSGMLVVTSMAALATSGAGASAANVLPTLTMALNGKTVVVGGTVVSGAVNIQTTVTGEAQGGPGLVLLKPGEPFSVFGQAVAAVNAHHGDLNYIDPYGSLIYDGVANKGTSTEETELPAGNYIALDSNANGAPPHATFTVAPSAAPAALPKPQATIASIEFGFTGPKTLHDGELVEFVNSGFLVHMDVWEKVKNMADAKLLMKGLLANSSQRKLGKLITAQGGFANPMSTGGLLESVITAPPGIYVQDCFMNTQDGRLHTQLGMERIFKIVK
ncbi:MAG TPA: hypothetical protein VIJ20_06035 [Solirubrobacteraceae bacterium]